MLWIFFATQEVAADNPPKRYTMCVYVTDSISHHAMEAVSVSIPKLGVQQITDANGMFCLSSIAAGFYEIKCAYVGYHTTTIGIRLNGNDTINISLCPESHHLHEVVVSDNFSESDKAFSLQHKQILDINQIQMRNGQNITELLKNINGMNTLTSGPNISKPVLRGLHSQRLVMMQGNVRMEGQQWGAEHAPEIDPFAVGRVEVLKGASSVEFGAEAIGGVIRLMPRAYRQQNGIAGELTLNGFSNNRQGAVSIHLDGSHANKLKWKIQMSARKAGDSKSADYVISNTAFRENNMTASMQYKLTEKLSSEISYSSFATTIGIFSGAHLGNTDDLLQAINRSKPLVIRPFTYSINRPYQEVSHKVYSGKLLYQFGKKSSVHYQFTLQNNQRKEYDSDQPYNQALRELNLPAFYLQIISQSHELKMVHKWGAHWSGYAGIQYTLQNNFTSGLQFLIPDFISHAIGAFALTKVEYEKWSAEAGVRFDHRNLSVAYQDRFTQFDTTIKFSMPTAIFSFSRKLPYSMLLITTLSNGWRAPAINELYSNGLHMGTATYEIGNNQLQPEVSYMLDMTLKYQSELSGFECSVYNNYMHNYIYQLPDLQPTLTVRGAFPTMRFVQTEANLLGFDASYNRKLWKSWYTGAAYSFLHATDITKQQPLLFMPANRARISITHRVDKWGVFKNIFSEISGMHVSMQNRVVSELDYASPPPGYLLFNLNTGFDCLIRKQTIRFSIGINNLFNAAYRDYLSRFRYFTDDTGRNFILRLTIPFNIINNLNQ